MNEVNINPHLIRCSRKDNQPSGLAYTPANPDEVAHSPKGCIESLLHLSLSTFTPPSHGSLILRELAKRRNTAFQRTP
jgi:hypothetical protein